MTDTTIIWVVMVFLGLLFGACIGFVLFEIREWLIKRKLKKLVKTQKPKIFNDGKIKRDLIKEMEDDTGKNKGGKRIWKK